MQFWPVISLEYPGVSQGTIESPTEKCWSRNSWIFFLLAFSGIGLNHCTLIRDFVFLQGCVYVIRYEHWAWIPSFIKAKAFSLHTNNGKIFILLAHSYHFFPWKQKDGGGGVPNLEENPKQTHHLWILGRKTDSSDNAQSGCLESLRLSNVPWN